MYRATSGREAYLIRGVLITTIVKFSVTYK